MAAHILVGVPCTFSAFWEDFTACPSGHEDPGPHCRLCGHKVAPRRRVRVGNPLTKIAEQAGWPFGDYEHLWEVLQRPPSKHARPGSFYLQAFPSGDYAYGVIASDANGIAHPLEIAQAIEQVDLQAKTIGLPGQAHLYAVDERIVHKPRMEPTTRRSLDDFDFAGGGVSEYKAEKR